MIKPLKTTMANQTISGCSKKNNSLKTKTKKTKDKVIVLRINNQDKEKFIQLAEQSGVSVSEFLISSALKRQLPPAKIDTDTYATLTQLLWEVNKIGTNFNQFTKTCHTSRQLGEPVIVDSNILLRVHSSLNEVIVTITKAITQLS